MRTVNHGWAVVTGASSGIGSAFARELARRAYRVLAIARRYERLEVLSREAANSGGMIEPLAADLSTTTGRASVVSRIQQLDEIDLLVNNAGVATGGDFVGSSLENEIGAIQLNIEAVVALTHAALQRMVYRRRGAIINVASVVAFQPFPHFAVYGATKAFVLSFSESIAEELKGSGIKIVALCPGTVSSEMDMFAHNAGLLGKLPALETDQVVQAGLDAVEHGDVVRVVGWLNRFLPLTSRVMPRSIVRWVSGAIAKPPGGATPSIRER
jgi:short-subunit dehydrogenase